MVFFTAQCKFVTTMDSLRKEAVENTLRTNTVGTITSTRNQTVLKSKRLMSMKTTNVRPVIRRLYRVKAGQLPLLILQTTLPRTFFRG